MSWIELHGEVWTATDDVGDLCALVRAPDVSCPRVSWDLELFHCVRSANPQPDKAACERWISIDISDLPFREKDWRGFSNWQVRGCAALNEAAEYSNEYGRLISPMITSNAMIPRPSADGTGREERVSTGQAHDFIVRFGTRDGWVIPCELDAWLIDTEAYYRSRPETPEELARPPHGPPNLRVVMCAVFTGGRVDVPRCSGNPIPWAQRMLREETGCEELHNPNVSWMSRHTADRKKIVPMPGWRSTVSFTTRSER